MYISVVRHKACYNTLVIIVMILILKRLKAIQNILRSCRQTRIHTINFNTDQN